ncbi:MAG: acyltransferase domain-containing protein, partial [Deltaproteobacteria bacterium]|nr:acyltransferase domain-containing protein [Deltaproteobacteria bacterium]
MTTSSAKSSQGGTAPQEMFDANEPIAIIGMAALFPKAADLGQYWRNIVNKEDCISEVPATHWSIDDYYDPDPKAPDKTYCKRGGFIPDVKFDPAAFGIPPHVVKATDTGQLLGLHVAAAALKDARLEEKKEFDRDMCNVILGVGGGQEQGRTLDNRIRTPVWRRTMIEQGVDPAVADSLCKAIAAQFPQWEENSFPGLLGNVVSGRIANRLNLGGTNLTVDAACASGLAAAHTAVAELRGRLANISLTGAVDADNDVFMFMCFSKTPAFSASNEARPFDAKGDGILIAEGVGMCVLKRLADAERDGDRIYAVIRSIGTSSDGRYKSIYAPNPDGQSKALHRAYTMAGFSPETVELVEAHGTGTKAGDFAEFSGLNRAFRQYKAEGQWCALGSVKSQIGHSKGVAGIAGLIKAVMAVHEKVLPPTIKVTEPNPKMEIEKTPFYLNTEARPWFRPTGSHPRRAGVSAFGFGGTNFHCVLEEYVQPAGQEPALTVPAPTALFVLGGQTGTDVVRLADALEAVLHKDPDAFRREAHRTQKTSVRGEKAILSVVASSVADLSEKLALARRHIAASPEQIFTQAGGVFYGWRVDGNVAPKVAVLFPGQGSQYVNMGMQWALRYPEVRRAFEDADRLMLEAGETPLSQVAFPHPTFTRDSGDTDDKRLTETRWAQPALGALSMGLYDVLKKLGLSADFFGGHSYGELAALWAAGVLGKDDFLALSRARGTLMGQAASALERSGMSSAQGPVATMQHVLPSLSRDVIVANINSPEQCVIAGPVAELQRIQGSLETQGFLVSPLNVSAAFHSPFVAAAKDPFSAALRKASFGHARKPVFSNVTAKPYPANGAGRDVLADQLVKPVNFLGLVQEMYDSGARVFLEVGAKGVLSGLVSRILGDKPHAAVAMDASAGKTHGDTAMQLAVAQLVSRGVHLDLNYLVDRDPTTELKPREPNTATTITIRGPNPKANPPPAPKNPPRIGLVTTTGSATVSAPAPAVAPPPTPTVSAAPRPTPPPPPPPPRAAAPAPTTIIPSIIPAPATERITSVPTPTVQVISPMTNPTNPPNPALLMSTQAALAAFQAHQQQMAMVHHEFLRASQEAMRTFTTLFEAHARQMAGAGVPQLPPPAMTTPPPTLQPITVYPSVYTQAAPVAAPPPPVAPVVTAAPPPPPRVVAPAPVSMPPPAPVVAARPTPPPPPAPRPAAAAAGPAQAELSNALLSVVSEKTGYPQDMLKLDMDMEADLGIDSIKRVEILGAMQAKFPNAPKVETEKLGELHTLQQILEYLARGAAAPVAARPAAPVAAPAAAPGISTSEMTQGLLAVVSEKTGYPVDMLKLEMDMEADLGIDSIKRVEILG